MKRTTHLTLDSDIIETAKIRRFKDPKFSLSEEINNYLRSFFEIDVKTLEQDKIVVRKAELEREMALLKAQEQALEREKVREKEEHEKKYGKEVDIDEFANEFN